jgi:hypothetical protein
LWWKSGDSPPDKADYEDEPVECQGLLFESIEDLEDF